MPALVVVVLAVGTLAHADAPVGRFTVNAGGTVTDNVTHLTWQQAASPTAVTWASAKTYCTGGWRLPNIRELQSIVDERRYNPALDPIAFPSAPSDRFWTGSPDAYDTIRGWTVDFSYGYPQSTPAVGLDSWVRCVR
jgi:hypothetical protein